MPRPNYGNAVKQRAVQFFTVLLDYANDELDLEERRLEILQREIKFNWQTNRRCAIRTKVRYLEDLCRLAGVELTNERIKESIKCLTDFLGIVEDNRTSKGGSETWHFTLKLWHDRFDRSANLHKFNTEWDLRKATPVGPNDDRATAAPDEWLELIKSSLVTQQYHQLTTNPLMGQDRLKFSLDRVYIPLGSIEKSTTICFEDRDRQDDFGDDTGEKIIPDLDRFLAQLIDNSEPNRISIIGEPGSGKTTCLQKLAAGLLERQLLPIWLSLAELQGESLENYLLQDWLKIATKKIVVDPKLQQDFADRVASGRVWLLLDAVDEMAIDASIALTNLARQFRGWLGNAHIIITCRSNVWNSGKNALENFTTYRNLGLSYGYDRSPNQVRQFIQGWFKDNPHLGDRLTIELGQPQYQRLRDAIKNPLRLALLCSYWVRNQGKLPSTKAILYQQFTDTIYEWKQDRFPTTLLQRQQLDFALGKLALSAIDGDLSSADRLRFRLEHHTVLAQLDPELLELALQLGWLDRVGISARTGVKTYAFYHSTFQEYFAARSITDWRKLLVANDGVGEASLQENLAPIFSPYWQETILFWFGRIDVPSCDKEACLDALINYDRQCGGFYYYRAYFLAALALAEFPESIRAVEIIDRLLQWRFAEYLPADNTWTFYPLPIQDGARVALRQTDRVAAIAGLERFVRATQNPFLCWQAAHSLGKIFDPGNAIATQSLVNTIAIVNSEDLKIKICESLTKIAPNYSQIAIDTLVEIINAGRSTALVRKAAFCLGKLAIDPGFDRDDLHLPSMLAIDTLATIIESSQNPDTQKAALDNLRQIAPTHPISQHQFTSDRTLPSSNRHRRKKTPYHREIAIAIAQIEQKIANVDRAESQRRYAYQLGKFQPGHPIAVDTLLTLMSSPQSPSFYKRTGEYIKDIILSEQLPLVITRLKDCIKDIDFGDRSHAALECYKLLWYCAERLPERQFDRAWNES